MTWRCERCDEPHETDEPPCDACGHGSFERVADSRRSLGTVEWVCRECGRAHPKHSPPCSRCGHGMLEKQPVEYDLDDIEPRSYFELGKWQIAATVALIGIVGLAVVGVVAIPEIGGNPTISDAPGEGERAAGLDLVEAETGVHDRLDRYRAQRDLAPLSDDPDLDAVVTYHNRHRAIAAQDEDLDRPSILRDYEAFDHRCPRRPHAEAFSVQFLGADADVEAYENESALAGAVADGLVTGQTTRNAVLGDRDALGLDLYVRPDGTVYVALFLC